MTAAAMQFTDAELIAIGSGTIAEEASALSAVGEALDELVTPQRDRGPHRGDDRGGWSHGTTAESRQEGQQQGGRDGGPGPEPGASVPVGGVARAVMVDSAL